MKKTILASTLLITSFSAFAGGHAEWGYSGDKGPDSWARLSPDYTACAGRNQSPVNLDGFIASDLKPISFHYKPGGREILNNGHTVQINYTEGSRISIDGKDFKLLQFHFHAPSENHIKGKSYPLEAHLVHADDQGHLAVIAVMFEKGRANLGLKNAWQHMPEKSGDKQELAAAVDVNSLLPADRSYYRFNGSLTTPPCSEGVRWLVMKHPMTASADQVEAFKHVMHHDNNRPVQPLNARVILK